MKPSTGSGKVAEILAMTPAIQRQLDEQVARTADPRRLRLLVKLYSIDPESNTPAQRQQLAAAVRLLKEEQ